MTISQQENLVPNPEYSFRRHALLILLGCITASSLVSLALTPLFAFTTLDILSLTLLVLKSAVLLVWLWRRPSAFRIVGLVELGFEVIGGVYKFTSMLLVQGFSSGVSGYSHWLPLMYLVATLVLPARAALGVSLALFALLLGIGMAYTLPNDIPATTKVLYGNWLVQLYLMHAAFIACLALLGNLRAAYTNAIRQAEHQARLANVDVLTGLPNRRQLTTWLEEGLVAAKEAGGTLSVLTFDLDHFKRVNDTYGHEVGDEVLRMTARSARSALREGDLLGRWGGEEFLIILPNCDLTSAGSVARRLQVALGSARHPQAGLVTVSCGAAQMRPDDSAPALLKRADEALYAAKNEGRNLVRTLV